MHTVYAHKQPPRHIKSSISSRLASTPSFVCVDTPEMYRQLRGFRRNDSLFFMAVLYQRVSVDKGGNFAECDECVGLGLRGGSLSLYLFLSRSSDLRIISADGFHLPSHQGTGTYRSDSASLHWHPSPNLGYQTQLDVGLTAGTLTPGYNLWGVLERRQIHHGRGQVGAVVGDTSEGARDARTHFIAC